MIEMTGTHGAFLDRVDRLQHRYLLWRFDCENPKCTMTWIMLNPSIANEAQDDHTIKKCRGFAKKYHCDGIVVVNLCSVVATDPKNLRFQKPSILYGKNYEFLEFAIKQAGIIVGGWGNVGGELFPDRVDAVRRLADDHRRRIHAFGVTKSNQPKHPGRIGYDQPGVVWR